MPALKDLPLLWKKEDVAEYFDVSTDAIDVWIKKSYRIARYQEEHGKEMPRGSRGAVKTKYFDPGDIVRLPNGEIRIKREAIEKIVTRIDDQMKGKNKLNKS